MIKKLRSDQLYRFTHLDRLAFSQGEADIYTFMQHFHPRAYQSLNFGLHLKRNQNHIFVMGESGVGRIGMTKAMLLRAAKKRPVPDDVVLASDFSEHNKTQYLYFPAGYGAPFKQAIEELITQLKTQLPVVFDGHAYQLRSQQLENELAEKQEAALEPAFELADELGIEIIQKENSFVLKAIVGDKKLSAAELKSLDKAQQHRFHEAMDKVEEALNKGLAKFPFLQHEYLEAGRKLNTKVANEHISPLIAALKMEFGKTPQICQYLDDLQKAVVAKLHLFWDQSAEQVTLANTQNSMEELMQEQQGMSVFEVNLLVDHRGLDHAPVIYEQNATMPKLFGYAINSAQANATDPLTLAMSHQAGLLQKANGGYLILSIQAILKDPEIWTHIKAALMSKKLTFEIPSSSSVVPYHLPDFPLDVTLVLVGQAVHFYALLEADSEFSRLFKVQVEFEVELERTPQHELTLAKQLSSEIEDWEDLTVDISAYERLVEYAAWEAEDEGRLYTNKAILRDLMAEAFAYARANEETLVTRETIEQTIQQRAFHTGLMEEAFHRGIVEQQVLISLEGRRVGQANGLTYISIGNQSFGQPVRITAQVSAGDEGVVDIEREIEMSGPIHSKGVMILSGYLRGKYMKEIAYGFTASIVMEQTYEGIDGDSASSAELLALLSALAEVPLRQDIAITGSVNQFGEIQPVGGAIEKIEGYFKICQARGLTGEQGVLIPEKNVRHLMLNAEVRKAVEAGDFHIFSMQHIEDAMTLLSGLPMGETDSEGHYPENSINGKIMHRLEVMKEKNEEECDAKSHSHKS
jgi:Lon-like ATP-dependent protease